MELFNRVIDIIRRWIDDADSHASADLVKIAINRGNVMSIRVYKDLYKMMEGDLKSFDLGKEKVLLWSEDENNFYVLIFRLLFIIFSIYMLSNMFPNSYLGTPLFDITLYAMVIFFVGFSPYKNYLRNILSRRFNFSMMKVFLDEDNNITVHFYDRFKFKANPAPAILSLDEIKGFEVQRVADWSGGDANNSDKVIILNVKDGRDYFISEPRKKFNNDLSLRIKELNNLLFEEGRNMLK